MLNSAVENEIIISNPASRLGKFSKSEKPANQAAAMTKEEAEHFLSGVRQQFPEWYPFFLTALRSGLRKGELIALKWGDVFFGADNNDSNRYLIVQRNWSQGQFTTPKSKRSRRVDLSQQLPRTLREVRDKRMMDGNHKDPTEIADQLVFPSQAGTPIKPDNIAVRYMYPVLRKMGMRKYRFHDLRHTFGSLLIQDGASLAYVRGQLGHASIQITVDVYGHLVAGANVAWVDRLDSDTKDTTECNPGATGGKDTKQ